MTWREAFTRQAKSDYEMYLFLKKSNMPLCHQLHFLQMASEKLAKAWTCPQHGTGRPPQTHNVLLAFLRIAKETRPIRAAFKMSQKKAQYQAFIDSLRPMAQKIESLAPVGNIDKPNPEYPWLSSKQVQSPLTHPFAEIVHYKPGIRKFCGFLETCFHAIQ